MKCIHWWCSVFSGCPAKEYIYTVVHVSPSQSFIHSSSPNNKTLEETHVCTVLSVFTVTVTMFLFSLNKTGTTTRVCICVCVWLCIHACVCAWGVCVCALKDLEGEDNFEK